MRPQLVFMEYKLRLPVSSHLLSTYQCEASGSKTSFVCEFTIYPIETHEIAESSCFHVAAKISSSSSSS